MSAKTENVTPLHICFVSSLHPPDDKRVHYKEAVSLVRAGFRVSHVAPGTSGSTVLDGVEVTGYKGRRSFMGRLRQMRELYRLAVSTRADVYHCNELESWAVGVVAKIRTGAAVVFDVHEVYSTNVAERLVPRPLQPLVRFAVKIYIRLLCKVTDVLVFAKRSVAKDFPAGIGRVVLVQNYVEVSGAPENPEKSSESDSVVALHLGATNRARGWPQLLDAMTLVTNPHLKVRVVGQFGDGSQDAFLQRVAELNLGERIEFDGWIPYEDVPGVTAKSQIGLIVFQPVHDNFINALPHKLFDYMLAELPVIVPAFATEVSEIVGGADCGLLIDTTKPEEIAKALDRLAGDSQLRHEMGKRGRKAVLERYNWEAEAETLVEMYRELGRERSRSGREVKGRS